MSLKARLLKLKYYLFGGGRKIKLSDFKELSPIDPERGISLVHEDRSGKLYVRRDLQSYDIERYKYLKKRPVAHTPGVYFLEENEGVLSLIEEYIVGESLEFLLKKKGLMDENKVIDAAQQLCLILNDFHRCKKPITGHELTAGNVKVSVNGVVSLLEMNMEKYNRPNAKVENLPAAECYAAPEKADPKADGVLMDIYSLGVLMNVLLTGKHPDEQLHEGKLTHIIRSCTAVKPEERPQSAKELRAALMAVKKSLGFKDRLSSWNRYLLPGFRSKNTYVSFFSLCAYPMLIYISLFLNFTGAGAFGMLSRIVFLIGVLALVLFNGNYMEIRRKLPLTKSRRKFFRALGILLYNGVILLAIYGLLQAVEAIF